jgi:hypothetical protein
MCFFLAGKSSEYFVNSNCTLIFPAVKQMEDWSTVQLCILMPMFFRRAKKEGVSQSAFAINTVTKPRKIMYLIHQQKISLRINI